MARARTGTLVPPGRDGVWKAKITKTHPDGTTSRPLYSLGTKDPAVAERRLAELVAATAQGIDPETAVCTDTVREYATAWLDKRDALRLESAPDERRNLEHHVLPLLGAMMLGDVRSA